MRIYEYIWMDAKGKMRSKTKAVSHEEGELGQTAVQLPIWNYDGSSTGQASGEDSEVLLYPVARFPDPFRRGTFSNGGITGELVLCETYMPDGTPHSTNSRYYAHQIFKGEHLKDMDPMFGLEQEFFLVKDGKPLGFGANCYPEPQGSYYCGTGGDHMLGRDCVEEAFQNCLYANLALTGLNAEVAPAQWELQVCANGIDAADQLCVMRYILDRTAEKYGWSVSLDPKPIIGDWNGSGCHTNFSTKAMREEGGYKVILAAINKLSKKHNTHMRFYGDGNERRLTGAHETSPFDIFTWGVANRGASIRIPRTTEADGRGYFEDRRPAANMDPYKVTSLLFQTSVMEN